VRTDFSGRAPSREGARYFKNAKRMKPNPLVGLGFGVWSINAPKRFPASGSTYRLAACLVGLEGLSQSQHEAVSS